ncbi:hypothetical protein AAFM48_12490 [Burkholderia pseudomallei]
MLADRIERVAEIARRPSTCDRREARDRRAGIARGERYPEISQARLRGRGVAGARRASASSRGPSARVAEVVVDVAGRERERTLNAADRVVALAQAACDSRLQRPARA